jgi:hypothetical protein
MLACSAVFNDLNFLSGHAKQVSADLRLCNAQLVWPWFTIAIAAALLLKKGGGK